MTNRFAQADKKGENYQMSPEASDNLSHSEEEDDDGGSQMSQESLDQHQG